jgi:hypothetical protein
MPAAIDQELLALEKQYWDAIRNKGEIDKKTLAGMVENAPYELKKFRFGEDVHVRRLAEDVAIIAYKVSEEMFVDGKPATLEAFDSSVWVRRNGSWVCAAHTETLAGDPYGRR